MRWAVAPFEHYMLADDTKRFSMTCHMRFWFRGYLDRSRFEAAMAETVPRHPLFQAILVGSAWQTTGRLAWIRDPAGRSPAVSWGDADQVIDPPEGGMRIALDRSLGVRLWVRQSGGRCLLLVQFHHAVCDGAGLCGFIEDLLAAYAGQRARPLDQRLFDARARFGVSRAESWRRLRFDLARTLQFFHCFPARLAAPLYSKDPAIDPDVLASVRKVLSPAIFATLRIVAHRAGATLNDLLLRDLFVSLSAWNTKLTGRSGTIRIGIATCMRQKDAAPMAAANVVSMVFLDRSRRKIADGVNLLAGITAETRRIKERRLGMAMVRVLSLFGRARWLMAGFLRLPLCQCTAVLTNLGRPFNGSLATAGLELEEMESLPPVREGTRAAFSVNYFGEQLSITMRFDSSAFGAKDAQAILDSFCDHLRRTAHAHGAFTIQGGENGQGKAVVRRRAGAELGSSSDSVGGA